MRCSHCKSPVAAGAEARKMIVEYSQPDGSTRIFGYQMADGPLSAATGQILRGWHHKCYHVVRKREARGDAVTGRTVGGGWSGYDIGAVVITRDEAAALGIDPEHPCASTRFLSTRLDTLRAISREVGKPVGDPYVTEAFRAAEAGGPYPHAHQFRLEPYHLQAHMKHAHGVSDTPTGYGGTWLGFHTELHARAANGQVRADRRDDPGHAEPAERDWRVQTTADLDEITTE